MAEWWDEFFLEQRNNQLIHSQMAEAADEEWMMFSEEECLEAISEGSLQLQDGRNMLFKQNQVFNNQMTISMPNSFIEEINLREGNARKGNRRMFQDNEAGVTFGMHWMDYEMDSEQIEDFLQIISLQAVQLRPEMKILNQVAIESNQQILACYEGLFLVEPYPYYQVVFLTSWHGKALLGSYQYKLEDAPLWYPLSYALLRSISW